MRLLRLAAALRAGERLLDGCWPCSWLLRLWLWRRLLRCCGGGGCDCGGGGCGGGGGGCGGCGCCGGGG